MSKFFGVVPPVVTPLNDDFSVDYASYTRVLEYLIDNGCHGLFPLGSTSEVVFYDEAERRRILEHTVNGSPETQIDDDPESPCDCRPPSRSLPPSGAAVRVTVCMPLAGNVPDLLASFGFPLAGRHISQSTTWRYEH